MRIPVTNLLIVTIRLYHLIDWNMMRVGFEPTPFQTKSLIWRLRPTRGSHLVCSNFYGRQYESSTLNDLLLLIVIVVKGESWFHLNHNCSLDSRFWLNHESRHITNMFLSTILACLIHNESVISIQPILRANLEMPS